MRPYYGFLYDVTLGHAITLASLKIDNYVLSDEPVWIEIKDKT